MPDMFTSELLNNIHFIRSVFQSAPIAIALIEMPDLRYLIANNKYCGLLASGITSETIAGKTVHEVLPTPNEEGLAALHLAHQKLESTTFGTLKSISMASTETFWTGAVFPLARKANGNTWVIGIMVDITDKVMAERKSLERAQSLTNTLNRTNQDMREQSDFVHMVTHEIRTPITCVKAITELMLMRQREFSSDDMHRCLTMLKGNSSILERLMLDLAKHDQNIPLVFENENSTLNIIDMLECLVAGFQSSNPSHRIAMRTKLDANTRLRADKIRLEQVLLNLLHNSAKFSPKGSTITIHVFADEDDQVAIEIEDSGIGIDKALLARVFDRFYRVLGRDGSVPPGRGLGLYIAKTIVENMQGKIWAESDGLNQGTRICIRLKPQTSGVIA